MLSASLNKTFPSFLPDVIHVSDTEEWRYLYFVVLMHVYPSYLSRVCRDGRTDENVESAVRFGVGVWLFYFLFL